MPDDPRRPFQPNVFWSGESRYGGAPAPAAPPDKDAAPVDWLQNFYAQQPGLIDKLIGKGLALQSLLHPSSPTPTRPQRGDIELPSPNGSIAALRRKTQSRGDGR